MAVASQNAAPQSSVAASYKARWGRQTTYIESYSTMKNCLCVSQRNVLSKISGPQLHDYGTAAAAMTIDWRINSESFCRRESFPPIFLHHKSPELSARCFLGSQDWKNCLSCVCVYVRGSQFALCAKQVIFRMRFFVLYAKKKCSCSLRHISFPSSPSSYRPNAVRVNKCEHKRAKHEKNIKYQLLCVQINIWHLISWLSFSRAQGVRLVVECDN